MHNALIHRHFTAKVFVSKPPVSVEIGEQWLRDLVRIVDMQILMDAKAIYCEDLGNEGLTGVVCLSTSHAAFHAWHLVEHPFIMFDLYSCSHFDTRDVIAHLGAFDPISGHYSVTDRDTGDVVERGEIAP